MSLFAFTFTDMYCRKLRSTIIIEDKQLNSSFEFFALFPSDGQQAWLPSCADNMFKFMIVKHVLTSGVWLIVVRRHRKRNLSSNLSKRIAPFRLPLLSVHKPKHFHDSMRVPAVNFCPVDVWPGHQPSIFWKMLLSRSDDPAAWHALIIDLRLLHSP